MMLQTKSMYFRQQFGRTALPVDMFEGRASSSLLLHPEWNSESSIITSLDMVSLEFERSGTVMTPLLNFMLHEKYGMFFIKKL